MHTMPSLRATPKRGNASANIAFIKRPLTAIIGLSIALATASASAQTKPSQGAPAGAAPLNTKVPASAARNSLTARMPLATSATGNVVAVDPRPALLSAMEAAIGRSPGLLQADAEYRAAKADVSEVKGQRWPQVQISSQTNAVTVGGPKDDTASNRGQMAININTNVYDWGRVSKLVGSRSQLVEAGLQHYNAEMDNTAYQVASYMTDLAKQRQLVSISEEYVTRMTELVRMLGDIVQVDKGRASELTQAKARLLQAEAMRDDAQAKARNVEINLRKLIGDRPLSLPASTVWNVTQAPVDSLLGKMDDHPSLLQAHAEAESARLYAGAVKAAALPALNWQVSKATGRDIYGRQQGVQTMLTLNWNAFQGGSARAAHLAAIQRAEASEHKLDQQRLDIETAIRAAHDDAKSLLGRASLYANLSTETDTVRKAFFDQWYHLSRRTLLDVLIAESEYYGNRMSEVQSRFDGYQAVFREYASAGELVRWMKGH